jgi:hypothetical protein
MRENALEPSRGRHDRGVAASRLACSAGLSPAPGGLEQIRQRIRAFSRPDHRGARQQHARHRRSGWHREAADSRGMHLRVDRISWPAAGLGILLLQRLDVRSAFEPAMQLIRSSASRAFSRSAIGTSEIERTAHSGMAQQHQHGRSNCQAADQRAVCETSMTLVQSALRHNHNGPAWLRHPITCDFSGYFNARGRGPPTTCVHGIWVPRRDIIAPAANHVRRGLRV